MIKGLEFDVTTEELSAHLTTRIAHHNERAAIYKKQMEMLGSEVETPTFSNKASIETAQSKMVGHLSSASQMTFWRDHLVPDETYRLNIHDLRTAEFTDERW